MDDAHGSSPRQMVWPEADSLLPASESIPFNDGANSYPIGDRRRARLALYGSHFLSTWGQRAWEFLIGLVLLTISPSLLLVSIFGLCDAAAVVLFGPLVGTYVSKTPRLRAACTMYVFQNILVAISAASCLLLVLHWSPATQSADEQVVLANPRQHGPLYWSMVVIAILAGSLSSVGALGATLSVEREWTKALSGGDSDVLASMNAVMKRIDLTCLIASPIVVAQLMRWRVERAIVAVVVWNLGAWMPECSLLRRAQRASPALAAPKSGDSSNSSKGMFMGSGGGGDGDGDGSSAGDDGGEAVEFLQSPPSPQNKMNSENSGVGGLDNIDKIGGVMEIEIDRERGGQFDSIRRGLGCCCRCLSSNLRVLDRCQEQIDGWIMYVKQPAAVASFSLALLYLSVMSFGSLMTAYLYWSGMGEAELSIYRGAGALSGIAATIAYPPLQRRWGLVKAGTAAVWLQCACLVGAAAPVLVATLTHSAPSAHATRGLVAGLVLSRFGLWGFDLAVNQIIQETVEIGQIGVISGAQGSLQSLFQMLSYVAGVVVSQPERFPFLMAGSVGVVGFAAVLFTAYALAGGCSHMSYVPRGPMVMTP